MEFKSDEQVEIETTCKAGFESYLSQKHSEFVKYGFESALLGAVIGVGLTVGASYLDGSGTLKITHAWIPASIALLSSLIITAKDYHRYDEEHKKDFEKVCESI